MHVVHFTFDNTRERKRQRQQYSDSKTRKTTRKIRDNIIHPLH